MVEFPEKILLSSIHHSDTKVHLKKCELKYGLVFMQSAVIGT